MTDTEKAHIIRDVIETYYGVELAVKSRAGEIPKARHFFFFFCNRMTSMHDAQLAKILKPYSPGRCSVMYSRKTITAWLQTDKYIRMQCDDLAHILADRLHGNEK